MKFCIVGEYSVISDMADNLQELHVVIEALRSVSASQPQYFLNHGVSRGRRVTPRGLSRRDIDTAGTEWAENASLLVDCNNNTKNASHHAPQAQTRRLPVLWFYSLMLRTPTHS